MEKSGQSWSTVTSGRKVQLQPVERDRILLSIQDMFNGQVDGDVVYMVLQESEWKAEEAVEKLLQLSQGSSGSRHHQSHGLTMKSVAQTISNGNRTSGPSGQRNMNSNQGLQLDLKSRLPSVGNQDEPFADGMLPVLSPRTPGTAGAGDINFPNFPQDQTNNSSFRTALSALDSYANNTYSYGTGFSTEGGSYGGVWDFGSTTGGFDFSSSTIPNIPPPPINDPNVANYGDGPGNPFNTLPGLNNFVIPTTSRNNTVSDSSQVYTLPTTSSTLLRPNSPRTSHNNVFSETSYNSPNRLSSVSSGLPSPFTPLNNIPPDFSNVNSTAGQTPSRQSSSGSNDGPPQPLPASSNDTSSQRLRKYNMSLNATERESLEKLIEEVIIGGVDQGFVDSEATSSEDEMGDSKKVKKDSDSSGKEASKPKEGKLYGSQMKVAAKHMKNLPPRFARRIQAAQKHADANLAAAAEKKVTTPEDEKKPKQKKKAGGLLEGIDSYFDEDEGPVDQLSPRAGQDANISELFDGQTTPDALQNLVLGDLSALATPPLVPSPKMTSQDSSRTPNSQVMGNVNVLQQASSVMNCEDLERELISSAQTPKDSTGQYVQSQFTEPPQIHRLAGAPINKTPQVVHSEQYLSLSEADRQKLSGFSVNAPEFVPRSVTPTKFVTSQAQPVTHVPPPPAPAPHTIVASPAQIAISSAVTMPPVKLIEGRAAVAPAVSQAFQHPPPPPKVPINRNSPFHVPLGRMSPQLVPHVASQGRHSPTHAYILPKPPAQVSVGATPSVAAAAQVHAAALQPAVPGIIPYPQPPYAVAFPAPPPPPPPPARFAHYAYTRPPFIPPGAPYPAAWSEKSPQAGEKVQGRSAVHKSGSKEKLWVQGSAYQNVHAPVSAQSTRIAANFHPPTVLSRGTKAKNEPVKQQQHLVHNKEGAALVAVTGSPIQLAMEKPVQKVDRLLKEGKFVMVILRGLPGSGKSSMAREMKKDGIVLTTDDFFIAENGQYKFDVSKLGEAHEFNQKRAKLAIDSKINPIIIDNTNTQQWEMKYYISLALKANYHIEILEPDTPWKFKPKECFKKNNHNVTLDHIQRMSERYEHNVTVESILKSSDKHKEEANETQQQQSVQGQNQNTDEQAPQPAKKSTRKRKRRKKKKNKEQKDLDGEKAEGKEDKEGASSDEDESTPDREDQTQKEKADTKPVAKENETNVSTSKNSEENVDNKADKKELECSNSVIKNAPSQPSEENTRSGKDVISDAIDLINNNSSKTDPRPSSPKLEPTVNESKDLSQEQVPNEKENEKNERNFESSGDKINKVDSSSSNSSASEEGGVSKTTLTPSRVTTLKNCDASEEDNAVSGTDSGGVSTPVQRRHSEIHLGEPAMLKEAIESSLKEVLSSAGSDSETQEELAAALRRKLFQRQVSKTLISEIEEIIKEKILENIINDEVAAITENVSKESDPKNSNVVEKHVEQPEEKEKIGNATEEAYWKSGGENKQDPYVISVKSNEVEPTQLTWTGEPTERAWEQPTTREDKTTNQGHASGSDSEPRKQRGPRSPNKRKPDTSVKLDADVKEQLVSGDWQIPYFTSENVCAETTNFQEKKEKNNVGTFTHPKDFSNIQRILNEKLKLTDEDGFIKMVDTRPRIISNGASPVERSNIQVLMLDKSCSVEEEMANPDGLSFLQKCFPSIDESGLQDVLTRCEGDLQWATNILLDSSLEYNKPVSSDKNFPNSGVKNRTVKKSPTVESPGASCDVFSPPLLAVLCHSSLPPATKLSSNNVQQTFYHGSVQRLKSIEEFKRQHSTPSESYDTSAEAVVDKQTDLSMLNPCSPGGTLKDDVFETLFRQKSTKKFIPPTFKRIGSLSPSPEDAGSSLGAEPSDSPAGQDEIDGSTAAAVSASIMTPIDEVIEEELKEVTTDFDVSLELPHALAKQLIKMFGPVAFHISPESLSQEDLTIAVNRGMAKRLHHCWAATLQEKFAKEEQSIQSMIEQDEALAKRLQEEENNRHMRQLTPSRNPAVAGANERSYATPPRPPSLVGINADGRSPNLRHIMDEEAAIEASKQAYLQENHPDAAGTEVTIATRLKRQKLQEIFPEIDTATLEEIFQSNGYILGATVSAINSFLGKVEPARDVMTDEALAAYEERLIRQAQEESLRLHERQTAAVKSADEEDVEEYQTMDDPGYQDFRAETSIHYQLRKECFQKAQEAFRRGLRQVAAFYSQQGHLHTVKLKEANRRAAAKIIELRNEEISDTNKVDLHGLHVDEALEVLAELLCRKEQELKLCKDKRKHWLFVVTGRGTHSQGGVARIKPVILNYLNRNKYTFTEIHAGMLKVQLKI